ncbi:hypothetical protein TNIN_314381, partial [Trichonephila inaurata madagascariensis]
MAARVRTTDPQRSCSGKEVAKHRLEKSPNDKLRNDDKRVPQPADTHLRAREVSESAMVESADKTGKDAMFCNSNITSYAVCHGSSPRSFRISLPKKY